MNKRKILNMFFIYILLIVYIQFIKFIFIYISFGFVFNFDKRHPIISWL